MAQTGHLNPSSGSPNGAAEHDAPARRQDAAGTRPEPTGYGHRIDAVVLAGTHQNPKRLINGRNKALLNLSGKPLVRHVVDALLEARHIADVFVVGPSEDLLQIFGGCERVHCVPQEGKMLSNSWAAIRATERCHADLPEDRLHRRPLLFISSDLVLISPAAIDDFIARSARADLESGEPNGMLVGVVDKAAVEPFHGDALQPGIERPFVHLAEGLMRLANIYVARPRRLAHHEFLQTGFSLRKAKHWRNVLKLIFSLFKQPGGWGAAWLTARLQTAAMLARGGGRMYRWIRSGNTMARMEVGVSTVLGGPVRIIVTPFGGLSLDVDEEEDYHVLSERYEEWVRLVDSVAAEASSSVDVS